LGDALTARSRSIAQSENLFALPPMQAPGPESRLLHGYRRRMPTRSELARAGEEIAARYLAARGWRIVGRNIRCGRSGEIDIIAERGGVLAFVEVKTRRTDAFGTPGESVTWRKQARIRALAREYLARVHPRAGAIRFDVVEVRSGGARPGVTHLESAF